VHQQTHTGGHTLDLVITGSDTEVSGVRTGGTISDHAIVRFSLFVKNSPVDEQIITSRAWRKLSRDDFSNDLAAATLCSNLDALVILSVDDMTKLYRDVLTALLDRHCSHLSRFVGSSQSQAECAMVRR